MIKAAATYCIFSVFLLVCFQPEPVSSYPFSTEHIQAGEDNPMMYDPGTKESFAGMHNIFTDTIASQNSPWVSWWAIAGYILLASLVIFWISYYRSRVLLKRNKLLAEKIYIRTAKLRESIKTQRAEIAHRKQVEKELKAKATELKEINNSKDKFYSIISHDLRGPFNSLLGFTHMLLDEYDSFSDKEKKEMLRHVNQSSENLLNLLENMLEWARMQTGRMKFEPRKIQINEVIESVIKLLYNSAQKKNIRLEFENDMALEAVADPYMLNSIIQNLTGNAIKFTESGGSVVIQASATDKKLLITIKDTGVGMPQKVVDRLFDVESVQSTKGTGNERGSGLGLILCKEMVDMHKGDIMVNSAEGTGTTFTVSLPVQRIENDKHTQDEKSLTALNN